jgi:tRNA(Ile)-lysidine synthase
MHPSPLVVKLAQFLHRHGIGPGGVVVAVSGGPDSMALLRALLTLRPDPQPGPLVIAHLNHQLRGEESDADEAFVREQHAALGAPGVERACERIDVAARARADRENLESVARRLRYGWLTEIAQKHGLRYVATGHTADDQAETVLHRLLRGAGLKGLRGIAPRRVLAPGIEAVRPLLTVSRAEVLTYLEVEQQPFRTDRSNADPRFTRNRIRSQLLPYLAEHYNPAIAQILARLAEQAEEACQESDAQTQNLLAEAERSRGGGLLYFDLRRLAAAPRHRVREVFRRVWEREGWPMGHMNFAHWDRLAGLVFGEAEAICLPGGISARARSAVLRIEEPSS